VSFIDPAGHIDPALLLTRIEAELSGCRTILGKVETAVETLLKSGNVAADDPLHIQEMQNIDLLDQILADLMLCLQDFAATPSIVAAAPARLSHVTRHTRLADLRNRLAGLAKAEDRGDGVELF
jgi:hypothetical protein